MRRERTMCLHGEALQLKTFSTTYLACKDESHDKDRSSCAFFAVQLRLEGRNKLRKGNLTGRVPVAAACTTDQKLNERVVIKQSLAFVIH